MENFQYSIQLSDQDWAEFSAAAEECDLLQASLASGDEPSSSDIEQGDSSGSSPPGPPPPRKGQLAPWGRGWPGLLAEDRVAPRQPVSRSWPEPAPAPGAGQQTSSTSPQSAARLRPGSGQSPCLPGSAAPADRMQRLLQGPAPQGAAPGPPGQAPQSPSAAGRNTAPQKPPSSPGTPTRSPSRKKRRTAGSRGGGRPSAPCTAATQPRLNAQLPPLGPPAAAPRGGLPRAQPGFLPGALPGGGECAAAPEAPAPESPGVLQERETSAPGHPSGGPPGGPVRAPKKKKVRFSVAEPGPEGPCAAEAPRSLGGPGAWDAVAVGPRPPQPRILKHLPPAAPSASALGGPGSRGCFALTLPEAYEFFFCDTIEEEDEGAEEAGQAGAQWPDVCEYLFRDGRARAPGRGAHPELAPPAGDPVPITTPEAYEYFLEGDGLEGRPGLSALPGRRAVGSPGPGPLPEPGAASAEQLDLAVRRAGACRVVLVPAQAPGTHCPGSRARTVGTISAIRHFRRQVGRGRRSPSP
ncbi:PREDICTED: PGC-1 and ERR-induced regulator in muscle protein 1 [Condylura cristata]|uniref:PGC-1 and ERR-induced regulator in muscle protein 1 n=1 Tax=Condylura cristata TaxID=143302 RepID=UPI000642DE4A|nr:PREDICTED: PGC-1 and ERR-induced regulator in muscle protein 1 [Condylura cristata]